MSSSNLASSLLLSQACESGKTFAELFYKKLDKNRHTMGQLFHDSAILVWNGNQVEGKGNILEFYGNLPTIDTQLFSIDAQPLHAATSEKGILVTCNGKMSLDSKTKCFTESFMLAAENSVWKIVTDTYRNY